METIEEINENFDVKKPKKKGLLITVIVVIALIIALIATYFLIFTKPQFIFSKAIDKMFVKTEEFDSMKMDYKLKASVETDDASIEQYTSEIEKYALKLGTQMDISEKKEIVDLGLEYDNEAVIDAQIYYNDGEMYSYFDGIFDKYIELDMDKETKEQLETIFENGASEEQTEKTNKTIKILRDELKVQIKEKGTFEQEKETIKIDGKEQKVTKSTLVLSQNTLIKIFSNICSNLSNNDEFIECVEDEFVEGDTIKEALKEAAKELKELDEEEIINIRINIYTKGLLNKFVGVDVETEINVDYQDIKIITKMIKEKENFYSYSIKMKSQGVNVEVVNGKIEIQEKESSKQKENGKAIITAEVAEMLAPVKAKIEIDYSAEYNKGIDKIDTSNSVKTDEITEEEIEIIIQELKKRPLIGDMIRMEESLIEKAETAAEETKKTQVAEAIALAKAEFLSAYYMQEIKLEEITEEKVKETIEEYLYEPYNIKVTKTPGKVEFIITVEGMEFYDERNKIDLSILNDTF